MLATHAIQPHRTPMELYLLVLTETGLFGDSQGRTMVRFDNDHHAVQARWGEDSCQDATHRFGGQAAVPETPSQAIAQVGFLDPAHLFGTDSAEPHQSAGAPLH